MTEGERKKKTEQERITEKQRYNYIGFEVFPGNPKDLFKSDSEKEKIEKELQARRESSETVRDDCTLLEERVSLLERVVLAVASVALIAGLMLPWYSAYDLIPIVNTEVAVAVQSDSLGLAMTAATNDSLGLNEEGEIALTEEQPIDQVEVIEEQPVEEAAITNDGSSESTVQSYQGESSNEEIITGHRVLKKNTKEYTTLSGIGTFLSLGDIGSYLFSSGTILVLTAVIMLFYSLLCIVLPILNFYSLFGLKGTQDEIALQMKRYLRYNWIPSILFIAVLFLSFIGSEYGFDTAEAFTSIGGSYGPGVFLSTISWGVFTTLAASIMVAVKGIEI